MLLERPVGMDRHVLGRNELCTHGIAGYASAAGPPACPVDRPSNIRLLLVDEKALGARRQPWGPCRPDQASSGFEPSTRTFLALGDLGYHDMLLTTVREAGVAWAIVDRGHPEGGEPRHIGPAEFRPGGSLDGGDKRCRGGTVEARHRARHGIDDLHVEGAEQLLHCCDRLIDGAAWGKAIVQGDRALVGDD